MVVSTFLGRGWGKTYFGTLRLNRVKVWTKLFTGTVSANKNYVTGTVPANESYVTVTVKKG